MKSWEGCLRTAILLLASLAGCSKSTDVKCGPGTVLVDDTCMVAAGSATVASRSTNALGSGSAIGSAQAPAVTAALSAAKPAVPQWSFTTEKDKMRDKSVYFAGLESPDGEMVISVRRGDPGSAFGLDVMLLLSRGQFQCASELCFYAVKFDEAPVERWPFSNAEGLNTRVVFAQGAARFLEKLRKAHSVIIEIKRFQGGLEQIAFDVPVLDGWQGLAVDAAANAAANAAAKAAAALPQEPKVNLDEFIETPAKR